MHSSSLDSDSGTTWTLHPVRLAEGAPVLPDTIGATVPGVVHTDLLDAALIVDPYLGMNEQVDAWIGHSEWAYRARIAAPADDAAAEHIELVFDGLDTIATVSLDGVELGRTRNQHRTYRFDVTDALRAAGVAGAELEVRFDDVWAHAEALRDELGDRPNDYPTPGNFVRKMAANFGWDWGPQLVTAGIWRTVRLESWSGARLMSVVPQVTVDDEGAGLVQVTAVVNATTPAVCTVRIAVGDLFAEVPVATSGTTTATLRVPEIERWWPRGMGAQKRYDLDVTLREGADVLDVRSRKIGFRTVALDTTPDAHGTPFTFIINGTPVFIRGANWIPEDCFPSRVTRERYRARLTDAVDANLNMIRVWGGGIYESFDFYDLCDELGLLSWQDFLFACATYPEEQPLAGEVEAEARDNVARLAGHPSLVIWNGNNENIWAWHDWGWQAKLEAAPGGKSWGLGYYTDLLPEIVAEIDPSVPYWEGSPYSGVADIHPNDPAHGNMHIWDTWNRVDYRHYADYRPRFASEFGFQGPATWSTIQHAIADESQHPDSPAMLLHQKAGDGNAKIIRGMLPHLPAPARRADGHYDLEQWHYLAQLNQARAVAFGTGYWRTLRPLCMGTIMWQLNDCWPVTSWSMVDGYGRRKPLWHAVRRVNAERFALIRRGETGLVLHLVNDGVTSWRAAGVVQTQDFGGGVHAEQEIDVIVAPLSSLRVDLSRGVSTVRDTGHQVVVARLDGLLDDRPVVFLYAEDLDLGLQDAPVDVQVGTWVDGVQPVTLTAQTFTRGASLFPDRLDAAAWVSDVDLDLFAGEPVTVQVHADTPLDAAALASTLRTLNTLVRAAR